jgi:Fe-S oxidoreductase
MREVLLGGEPGVVLEHPELWDCTTCSTCTLRCPRGLNPTEFIVGLRAELVEEGRVPKTVIDALEGTYKHGNPWGRVRQKRIEWKEDLEVKIIPEDGETELLYFIGCAPSYDPRLQGVLGRCAAYSMQQVFISASSGRRKAAAATRSGGWGRKGSLRS